MAIYNFTLLSWGEIGGIDIAQCKRYEYFKNLPVEQYYIFTEHITDRDVEIYNRFGIPTNRFLSAQLFFTDSWKRDDITSKNTLITKFLKEDSKREAINKGDEITILEPNGRFATIKYYPETGQVREVYYYNHERLIATDVYVGKYAYTNYYVTEWSESGNVYAKLVRRSYKNSDGTSALDILVSGSEEKYLFPDGRILSKGQFVEEFLKKLNLTSSDIVIIDRPGNQPFVQPLMMHCNGSKMIAFLHSMHYFLPNEDSDYVGINDEYTYFLQNIDKFSELVVSTEEQKSDIKKMVCGLGYQVPSITVIPVAGLDELKTAHERIPFSIITSSRMSERKHIDWLIRAIIIAHESIPELTFDIYGDNGNNYAERLRRLIEEKNAGEYIKLHPRCRLDEVYKNYQLFITASTWETLGLAMMEAIGSGLAMISLDVRYGARLFIEDEENGYLIPTDLDLIQEKDYQEELIRAYARAICKVFESSQRLENFHHKSYEIAGDFMDSTIKEKWLDLIHRYIL